MNQEDLEVTLIVRLPVQKDFTAFTLSIKVDSYRVAEINLMPHHIQVVRFLPQIIFPELPNFSTICLDDS
jgi:hypothetical protein